jgi:asparagine synthase (glutamine-hydrolysing)
VRLIGHADWSASGDPPREVARLIANDRAPDVVGDRVCTFATVARIDESSDRMVVGRLDHVSILADARIDNIDELRSSTGCDRDDTVGRVLAGAYLKWGELFPDRLVGDFAVLVWDAGQRRVFAARDPFGVRPLVYRHSDERLWVASQTPQLLPGFDGVPELNDDAIVEYVLRRPKTIDSTFFRAIREVIPGHVLVVSQGASKLIRYWRPPAPRGDLEGCTRDDLFFELRRRFQVSVRRRLQSKRPVIVHVSGGLDSSAIAMAADGLLTTGESGAPNIAGAAAVYPGLACDESPFIDAVAEAIHFPIERWDARKSDPIDIIEPSLHAPGARTTTTSGSDGDIQIARRRGGGVILSGLGGDDVMMADGFVRDLFTRRQWREGIKAMLFPPGMTLGSRFGRAKRLTGQFLPTSVRRYRARAAAVIPAWLAPRFRNLARELAVRDPPDLPFSSQVQRQAWSRLSATGNSQAIGAMQLNAEPLGLEYRFPYLDRELVEFALNLPSKCLPGAVAYARIHREAFRPILPAKIVDRQGKGEFTPALVSRVRDARALIEDLLWGQTWESGEYVDQYAARRFWRSVTDPGREANSSEWWQLWRMATLEVWIRRILRYRSPFKET